MSEVVRGGEKSPEVLTNRELKALALGALDLLTSDRAQYEEQRNVYKVNLTGWYEKQAPALFKFPHLVDAELAVPAFYMNLKPQDIKEVWRLDDFPVPGPAYFQYFDEQYRLNREHIHWQRALIGMDVITKDLGAWNLSLSPQPRNAGWIYNSPEPIRMDAYSRSSPRANYVSRMRKELLYDLTLPIIQHGKDLL